MTKSTHRTEGRNRERRLLTLLDLLRHAEGEAGELGLEVSAVLMGAAIAEVARRLDERDR